MRGMHLLPGLRSRGWINPSDKQPIVDIAQRVGHERCGFIMSPLSVNDEFILVVPKH